MIDFLFLRRMRIQLPALYPLELQDVSKIILPKKGKKENRHGIALFYPSIYSEVYNRNNKK
jgi:hypothetical protein